MSHIKYLSNGSPDLAKSAQRWLDNSHYDADVPLGAFPEQIERALERQLVQEDPRDDFPGLSQGNSCERKRVYQALGFDAEPFGWAAKYKFSMGDFIEAFWLFSALNAGLDIEHSIFSDEGQLELSLEIEGQRILGHPDGVLSWDGSDYIIEVKSMAQIGFDACNGMLSWANNTVLEPLDENGYWNFDPMDEEHWNWHGSYAAQAVAYQKALDIDQTLFLFAGRDNGIACGLFEFDQRIWEEVKESWSTVVRATHEEELPPRPEKVRELRDSKTTWKGGDSFPCSYCGFFKECHSDMNPVRKSEPVSGKSYLTMGEDNGN